MKAALIYEAHRPLRIEDLEVPTITDEEVLVQVAYCGVCHTDLKVVEGVTPFKPPTIIGHEISGAVARVGSRYQGVFAEGQRVIVGTRYRCGVCRYCRSGHENLCRSRPAPPHVYRKDGSVVNRGNLGGFAQYIAVPGYMVYAVPDGLSLDEASLIGCRVTTAYNAVKHGAELEPGESALVIGCGGVGLNTVQFLRCFGAYPIVAVDIFDEKLEAARRFGATHTINAKREDPVQAARAITDGGADKAFEAIGNAKTADQAVIATRPGGTAVIIGGLPSGEPFTISDGRFAFNEIKVTGVAMRRPSDVMDVLKMAQDRRIDLKGLISKRYGLEEINEAFEDLAQGRLLIGITRWN